MIDDVNGTGTQWARFSDDRKLRYRLVRALSEVPIAHLPAGATSCDGRRIVFVMLNPSTADAFILDPTVKKCVKFATAWGAEVVEVVNIFPLRSTDPEGLYEWTRSMSATEWADAILENSTQILSACRGADRVVAAWGKHGAHLLQGSAVRDLCRSNGIKLHYLDLNKDGSPKHPLYIKGGTEPKEWTI